MSVHQAKDFVVTTASVEAPHRHTSIRQYVVSRFTTLKPAMDKAVSPISAFRMLNREQWAFFICAWCAWIIDAFDFFTVSLTVTPLAKYFHKTNADITWGITLVLMFRSLGALIFGAWSDRYGRKWPFIFNNILFIALELGTGFCQTYGQFLACRALFGIAMGGLYGNAVATALEDCPKLARGVMSGVFQAGYPVGYLLATAFARALVDTTIESWRPLFWFSACPPVFVAIWRFFLPETIAYRERETARHSISSSPVSFLQQGATILRHNWFTLIYMVVLMAGFNFMAHGAQDLYPTMLLNQFEFTVDQVTVTQVIANCGAISGAVIVGYLSEIFGRRITIMASCVCAGALVYPYTAVTTPAVAASAFFLQFFVEGAFGVIPTHLMELSPGAIRSVVIGTAYQLGNLASSPAATIQATIGEKYYPLAPTPAGVKRYDYAIVICAFLGACLGLVFITTFIGPEKKDKQFGLAELAEEHAKSEKHTENHIGESVHKESA